MYLNVTNHNQIYNLKNEFIKYVWIFNHISIFVSLHFGLLVYLSGHTNSNIYMKSSDAKASKCHLKFSSLMMIFIKLVYLSSVISLK